MNFLWNLIGGGKTYSEDDCKKWMRNKNVNPQSGRKIGPTQSGRGVYHDLEQACLKKGMKPAKPAFVQPKTARLAQEPIVRTAKGRKSPAISATSVSVGTKRKGQDGQMYIVKLRANGTQYWQPCAQKTAQC